MDPAVKDQIIGALRILVPILLTMAVGKGWITADQVGTLGQALIEGITTLIVVGSVVWSILAHRQTSQIARVAAMPVVKQVVTTPEIADVKLKDDQKVVSS